LLVCEGSVLLEKRPPSGIWGGLWTFPQFADEAAAKQWLHAFSTTAEIKTVASVHHAFTHFDLALHPFIMHCQELVACVAEPDRYCWYNAERPAKIGLAQPVVKLLNAVKS
jgi:A/G-specific adenine glycosylase